MMWISPIALLAWVRAGREDRIVFAGREGGDMQTVMVLGGMGMRMMMMKRRGCRRVDGKGWRG